MSTTQPSVPRDTGEEALATAFEDLAHWRGGSEEREFPYRSVVEVYRCHGKHFVPEALHAELRRVRTEAQDSMLHDFLNTALDKPDGTYDYGSYLALPLLAFPDEDESVSLGECQHLRDVHYVRLLADLLRFELQALDGTTEFLPEMRPTPELSKKRIHGIVRALRPALERLAMPALSGDGDLAPREICRVLTERFSPSDELRMLLSMLPVDRLHDEYLFLRVLQGFELSFAWMVVHLKCALNSFNDGAEEVVIRIRCAEEMLRESNLLFSVLHTLRGEAFRTFRQFTEGASAIQSRSYKLIESLCTLPEAARLDSAAFHFVPDLRERVKQRPVHLEGALQQAWSRGTYDRETCERIATSLESFAQTFSTWRTSHLATARVFLGEATGTGYTEGVPYLAQGVHQPVFRNLDLETWPQAGGDEARPPGTSKGKGKCPF